MNDMLCGYLDDPRQWDEPEAIEEEDPLTDAEKRLEWICSDWADAIECDTADEWDRVRMALYGATQAFTTCRFSRQEEQMARDLADIAFDRQIDCIRRFRYEGAPQ